LTGRGAVERHLRVSRTARIWQLGEAGPATHSVWIACHGYGQLAAPFARALAALDDPGRVVAVPEALSRFYLGDVLERHGPDSPVGASWMTREDRLHEIADHVAYLDLVAATLRREIGRDVPITALGFSQGVATASRWAALGATRLSRLVLWGGSVPGDLPSDRGAALFHGARVVLVGGRGDHAVPVAALGRDCERLVAQGIPAELRLHDGGHSLNSALLGQLAS
jgi:predicted esterase